MAYSPVDMRPPVGAEPGLPLTSIVDATGTFRNTFSASQPPTTNDLLLNISPPSLNSEMGWLEMSQIEGVTVTGSHHDASATSVSVSGTVMTFTEAGRFGAHSRRTETGTQPANHTFSIKRDTTSIPATDNQLTLGRTTTNGSPLNIAHYAATVVPSNGLGISFGSFHNTAYSVIGFIADRSDKTTGDMTMFDRAEESNPSSSYWGINLGARQTVLASGTSLTSPTSTESATETSNILTNYSTIQVPRVIEGSDALPYSIGAVERGNHVVVDSCGLVGYEGALVVTAFHSVPESESDETYSGLNVQVHSGQTLLRNGKWYDDSSLATGSRYNYTDDTPIFPLQEALGTAARRSGQSGNTNDNQTTFMTGRNIRTSPSTSYGTSTISSRTSVQAKAGGSIYGDITGTGAWTKTTAISSTFLADKVPTRVKVVPSILRYENITVEGVSFRKPIVDYHILVSVVNTPKTVQAGNVTVDYTRGAPRLGHSHIRANYSEDSVTIYHAIFRLDPTLTGVKLGTTAQAKQVTQSAWGLHQMTPFRPLANPSWARIPKLCGTIEPGGFYQQGGISHLWDADAYGGELLVGADAIDASDFNSAVWGNGQVWADGGNGAAGNPRGSELLLFKWTANNDALYTEDATTTTNNPLYNLLVGKSESLDVRTGISISEYMYQWTIHDWVFPQVELMRYLGQERKDRAKHPDHTSYAESLLHPTIHCSSLRIMEDGKMMMAAIHRDMISNTGDYPSPDINPWPWNPDGFSNPCPPGFYYDSTAKTCNPIQDEQSDPLSGTGEAIIDHPDPVLNFGTANNYTGTNFGAVPPWGQMVANSSARSLILLWSDTPAKNGKVRKGKAMFDIKYSTVDGASKGTQNWIEDDTWWSGSRIAYWFPESAQRAIPITYGSYPEGRCSHAVLPKCLPHILSDGSILHGYPYRQMTDRVSYLGYDDITTEKSGIDAWSVDRYEHLRKTRFIPTTIGFADFGSSASPYCEFGWAGWAFPASLYNTRSYDTTSYSEGDTDAPFAGLLSTNVARKLVGPLGGFSHFGPLHYGLSSKAHPYRTDRTWKQVHAGLGYDIPLHLLAPGQVHVRARAGGKGTLDLELETPFSRTDTLHLEGAAGLLTGFDKAGDGGTIGQSYLRTNLWADTARRTTNSGNVLYNDVLLPNELMGGPFVSGNSLSAFWVNHPTDHFHAGAIPVMTGSDYDWDKVYTAGYPHVTLARTQELSKKDWVAVSEQLKSSVEVHVSNHVRPYWDSGSIVNATGVLSSQAHVTGNRKEMNDSASADGATGGYLGKGQRILRTPDGTLHQFTIAPSTKTSRGNQPTYVHYSKPPGSDLFWNRHAEQIGATTTGLDEVLLISEIGGSALDTDDKIYGAAFASDSLGTIHAVIEVARDDSASITGAPIRRLFYTYATRNIVASSPDHVYKWDWTTVTPINISATNNPYTTGDNMIQPTLVCDSKDRLHLAAVHYRQSDTEYSVVYSTKEPNASWVALPSGSPTTWDDGRWVSVDTTTSGRIDSPKLALRGDDIPFIFFRKDNNTANAKVYACQGDLGSGTVHTFGSPLYLHENDADVCEWYDAIINEEDRIYVVCKLSKVDDIVANDVMITAMNARDVLSSTTKTVKHIFHPISGDPFDMSDMTMTTNGEGNIHIVVRWRSNLEYTTVPTPEVDGAAPLSWPAVIDPAPLTIAGTSGVWTQRSHFMEIWLPSFEFDAATASENVIRSMNVRWLSVPSMKTDGTEWTILGAAETLAGSEDFTHDAPQLRYQRFWGHNAADLDLAWTTNPLAWYRTPHAGSSLYWPWSGALITRIGDQDAVSGTTNRHGF